METDCIFCKIARGDAPAWKVYEDGRVYAFLDIHPANDYHTLVIPKTHAENIFDIAEQDLLAVMAVVRRVALLYQEKLGIRNVQIINSSGHEAQQDVMHVHFHIVPRHSGDGQDVRWRRLLEGTERFDELLERLEE